MATKRSTKATPKATPTTDTTNVVKVAEIAKKHNINPKAVRARLRRMYRNEETRKGLPTPIGGVNENGLAKAGWNFDPKDRKAIEDLIASFVGSEE
jgi:hypothetical protein